LLFAATLCVGPAAPASGQAPGDDGDRIALADGHLQLTRPAGWKSRPPRSRIVEQELEVPAHEDDPVAGRVTIMGAGGSIEANIARWVGQFEPANGKPVERQVQVRKIANCDVHLVDLSGTYLDRPQGFRGPVVKRPDYRMLGAIIVTAKYGDYFVKLYGPKKTVDQQAEAFAQFIGSLKVD
jgi:hypothetical protein